jgi:uncharacterized DUF497 family protein
VELTIVNMNECGLLSVRKRSIAFSVEMKKDSARAESFFCCWYNCSMSFEYDPHKSDLNRAKHGIDFDEAQALWDDETHLEIPARNLDEPRFLVIGKIKGRHWSAVITYRDEKIRIISVRRSRDEEIKLYENESL